MLGGRLRRSVEQRSVALPGFTASAHRSGRAVFILYRHSRSSRPPDRRRCLSGHVAVRVGGHGEAKSDRTAAHALSRFVRRTHMKGAGHARRGCLGLSVLLGGASEIGCRGFAVIRAPSGRSQVARGFVDWRLLWRGRDVMGRVVDGERELVSPSFGLRHENAE